MDLTKYAPKLAKLAAHLLQCDRLTLHGAELLTIKGRTTLALRYTQIRDTLPGCDAYARGEREHTTEAYWVCGPLPKCYQRNPGGMHTTGLQFLTPDGSKWIVAGYSNAETRKAFRALDAGQPDLGDRFYLHKLTREWDWAGQTPRYAYMDCEAL